MEANPGLFRSTYTRLKRRFDACETTLDRHDWEEAFGVMQRAGEVTWLYRQELRGRGIDLDPILDEYPMTVKFDRRAPPGEEDVDVYHWDAYWWLFVDRAARQCREFLIEPPVLDLAVYRWDFLDYMLRQATEGWNDEQKWDLWLGMMKASATVCGCLAQLSPAEHTPAEPKSPGVTKGAADGRPHCSHSPDFTSVTWYGTAYRFSAGLQARVVELLWGAWKSGTPTVSQSAIGERLDSEANRFRLSEVFRGRRDGQPHPAFGTMIQSSGKGVYQLVDLPAGSSGPANDAAPAPKPTGAPKKRR